MNSKTERKERALQCFAEDLHCSQSILAAFSEECGITEEQAFRLGSCFSDRRRNIRCANCGNENLDTMTFRRFTMHCSVCGHNTHTATGLDTRKIRNAVIILAVAALVGFCFWSLAINKAGFVLYI